MIICDVGPLVAVANKWDQHYPACGDFVRKNFRNLRVPTLVITEVCQLLDKRCGSHEEAKFLRTLNKAFSVVEPITEDYVRMAELVDKYSDLPLGAVDASVIAIAERLGITEVATIDIKHFSIVKPRHCERLTLLPG